MYKKILFIIIILLFFVSEGYCQNLNTLMSDLSGNFNYISDIKQFNVEDYWQTPKEFEKNKQGDCEDFAIYIADTLDKSKYQVKTYAIRFKDRTAHAINVVRDLYSKEIYITSNYNYQKIKRKSISDIRAIESYYKNTYNETKEFKNIKMICRIIDNAVYGKQTTMSYFDNLICLKKYLNI